MKRITVTRVQTENAIKGLTLGGLFGYFSSTFDQSHYRHRLTYDYDNDRVYSPIDNHTDGRGVFNHDGDPLIKTLQGVFIGFLGGFAYPMSIPVGLGYLFYTRR